MERKGERRNCFHSALWSALFRCARGNATYTHHVDQPEQTDWISKKESVVHINKLVWDEDNAHGQIRRLDLKKVVYYQQQLLSTGDPVIHVKAYLVDNAGMSIF